MQAITKISDMGLTAKRLLIQGCLNILLGCLFIWFQWSLPELVVSVFIIYLILQNLWDLLLRIFKKQKSADSILVALVKTGVLVVFGSSSLVINAPIYILVWLIGSYQLLTAFMNGVTYWLYVKNHLKPRIRYLWDSIWQLILGISTLLSPRYQANLQFVILGGYLVLWGLSNLRDGFYFDKDSTRKDLKRKIRISLPIVIAAIIPATTLAKLNAYLQSDEGATIDQGYNDIKEVDRPVDLEVFVHVNEHGFGAIGHVDIAYKQQVISYGNYDVLSERLVGMVGDGVYFKANRDKYIEFCEYESNKTLLAYGLVLNDKQKQAVEREIANLESIVEPWQPPSQSVIKNGKDLGPMYAYKLQVAADAQLYKFKSSKFKTYFVLSTNCVLLADTILGETGTDILSTKGFIAPGTYQDYLNREFEKPNSIVVTKRAYQMKR